MNTRADLENQIQALTNCGDYEAAIALLAMEQTLRSVGYIEWFGFRGGPVSDTPPESVQTAAYNLSFWLLNLCGGTRLNITHEQSKPFADQVLAYIRHGVMELRQASA